MEVDVHDCPACHIDHQALDFTPITDERYFSAMCPETGKVIVLDTEEKTITTLDGE